MSLVPVPQVSVFLDNKPGSLSEAMGYLDSHQIKIFALSIAEAGEFGLVRMVVEDSLKASKVLEDADFNLAKSRKHTEASVILINQKDTISKISKILGDSRLNIEYAYSSAVHMDGKFALVLGSSDAFKADEVLKANGIEILSLEDMKQHFQ